MVGAAQGEGHSVDHDYGTGHDLAGDPSSGHEIDVDPADHGTMLVDDLGDDGSSDWMTDVAPDDSSTALPGDEARSGFEPGVEDAAGSHQDPSLDAATTHFDGGGIGLEEPLEAIVLPSAGLEAPHTVHGQPDADLRWAQVQSENGFCVPVAAGMIVSEVTGVQHDEPAMVQAAVDLDLLYGEPGAWLGMTTEGTVALLAHFGIESRVDHGTIDELRYYLDNQQDVILMVDSGELWTGTLNDLTPGGDTDADHAVVITGIDDTRAMITLNDPGKPDGEGWEVSIADFMDAWDDSNYEMVVTDGAGGGHDEAAALGGAPHSDPGAHDALHGSLSGLRHPSGQVLLPLVMGNETLRRPSRKDPLRDKER
jgi:hypothetical protein